MKIKVSIFILAHALLIIEYKDALKSFAYYASRSNRVERVERNRNNWWNPTFKVSAYAETSILFAVVLRNYVGTSIWLNYSIHKLGHIFKNKQNPSCVDFLLTNNVYAFEQTITVCIGPSDCHKLVLSILKVQSCNYIITKIRSLQHKK